nr:Hypothetical protein [Lactiplantibacillus plantarum]
MDRIIDAMRIRFGRGVNHRNKAGHDWHIQSNGVVVRSPFKRPRFAIVEPHFPFRIN